MSDKKASKLEVVATVQDLQVKYVRDVKELCLSSVTGDQQSALQLMGKLTYLQFQTDGAIEYYLLDVGWTVTEFYEECAQ